MKFKLITTLIITLFANNVFATDGLSSSQKEAISVIHGAAKKASENQKISSASITLHNYVLGKPVFIKEPYKLTVIDGGQFIPQISELMELYAKHTSNGVAPIDAIVMVYSSKEMVRILSGLNAK